MEAYKKMLLKERFINLEEEASKTKELNFDQDEDDLLSTWPIEDEESFNLDNMMDAWRLSKA